MTTQVKERESSGTVPVLPHPQTTRTKPTPAFLDASTPANTPPLLAFDSLLAPDTLMQIQRAWLLKVHYLCFCSEGRPFSRAASSAVAPLFKAEGSHQLGVVLASETLPSWCPCLTESHHIRYSPQEALDTKEHDFQATKNTVCLLCHGMTALRPGRQAPGPQATSGLLSDSARPGS